MRLLEMNFVDDKAGKPVGINSHIGRRPIAAFGNSDGDQEMLEWTQAGDGTRLMMLVHHDDAVREFAYGAESKIGTFSDALMAEAKKNDWTVISMKDDWKTISHPKTNEPNSTGTNTRGLPTSGNSKKPSETTR